MTDNVPITPGAGTLVATHQEASDGAQLQRVIPNTWAGGVATDVSAAAPLPVVPTGNTFGTLVAAAAYTAAVVSAAQTNSNARGATITVNVTAVSGTSPTLTPSIQAQDPASGSWYPLDAAETAISGPGLYTYQVYPGAAATGTAFTRVLGVALPAVWRVSFTVGGTSPSFTFGVGYVYHL